MDKATTQELLGYILESIALVKRRFYGINSSGDFLVADEGMINLMLFQ